MKRAITAGLLFIAGLFHSCGRAPLAGSEYAAARVSVTIHHPGLRKSLKAFDSVYDSLIVLVYAEDMDTIRHAMPVSSNKKTFSLAINDIPAGDDRVFEAFTKSQEGTLVHGSGVASATLNPQEVKSIPLMLEPLCGSLVLQLAEIPTSVDSVIAVFAALPAGVWEDRQKRSSKLHISLDYVTDQASGTLSCYAVNLAGDTLYQAHQPVAFHADSFQLFSLSFSQLPGQAALAIDVGPAGAAVVWSAMDGDHPDTAESGKLLISEIMYNANDSEYVEVFNTLSIDTTYDTLILEVDGTYRFFEKVSFKADSFIVIGRVLLPWANYQHATSSALNLSSTSGNWLTLRAADSTVIDRVAFNGKTGGAGWPDIGSAKNAIVLDSLTNGHKRNNVGIFWQQAVSDIDKSVTAQKGTPGSSGR
ncbi:MAG: hypothetical protein GF398_09775 [Chitinivibrionales bacterium]|nr:hypothetical protein [Chitinivibrionales bacterium]